MQDRSKFRGVLLENVHLNFQINKKETNDTRQHLLAMIVP